MKVRNKEMLIDYIDSEFAWRKKELINLKSMVAISEGENKQMLIRCGICLLYAHWEGYIRGAAEYCWNYIVRNIAPKTNLENLDFNIASVAIEKEYHRYMGIESESRDYLPFGNLMKFILENLNTNIELPRNDVIKTKSNLNFERFRKILLQLSIDDKPFKISKVHIDTHLVEMRNSIAHGNYRNIDDEVFNDIFTKTMKVMHEFDSQIMNIN